MLTAKFQEALRWRDTVESGKFIQDKNHTNFYMEFDSISQKELDAICDSANLFYQKMESNLRIRNNMGELISERKK